MWTSSGEAGWSKGMNQDHYWSRNHQMLLHDMFLLHKQAFWGRLLRNQIESIECFHFFSCFPMIILMAKRLIVIVSLVTYKSIWMLDRQLSFNGFYSLKYGLKIFFHFIELIYMTSKILACPFKSSCWQSITVWKHFIGFFKSL